VPNSTLIQNGDDFFEAFRTYGKNEENAGIEMDDDLTDRVAMWTLGWTDHCYHVESLLVLRRKATSVSKYFLLHWS
jgi:hypothetical protein